ncbi:conserved hypothetical protein [Ricinus communis]|uniref:Uncharacterized protein n=1 Tax=Ricinus communis TaxID=3988 RepID=B9TPR0_RICCO|nr:conserved hypothetical protein [Ricinus communis]
MARRMLRMDSGLRRNDGSNANLTASGCAPAFSFQGDDLHRWRLVQRLFAAQCHRQFRVRQHHAVAAAGRAELEARLLLAPQAVKAVDPLGVRQSLQPLPLQHLATIEGLRGQRVEVARTVLHLDVQSQRRLRADRARYPAAAVRNAETGLHALERGRHQARRIAYLLFQQDLLRRYAQQPPQRHAQEHTADDKLALPLRAHETLVTRHLARRQPAAPALQLRVRHRIGIDHPE